MWFSDSWIPSRYALYGFCIIFFGYVAQTSFLQYWFYYKRGREASQWKIQDSSGGNKSILRGRLGEFYGLPLVSNKPNRAPLHRVLTTVNLFVASCAAAFAFDSCAFGRTKMQFHALNSRMEIAVVIGQFLFAVIYESVVEYYWHRLMHWPFFYKHMHKFHHSYKSPEPWDDMYIHPLEAFGYYCILYGPPFLFPIHSYAFVGYMIVMGLCGVFDHSGIKIECPGIYNTVDHDNHHLKFEVNYSFPFPFMDVLHGTYEGTLWGKSFTVRNRVSLVKANGIAID